MTTDLRIIETCACGASINVVGSKYRSDGDTRNPRGAEEVVERWREDHKHVTAALGLAVGQEGEEKMMTPDEAIAMRDKLATYCRRELDIEDYTKSRIIAEALIQSGWAVAPPKNEGENDEM